MFDRYLLTAEIKRNGYTQGGIARIIGISPTTMSKKMSDGSFRAEEMWKLVQLLNIKHPETIFFASEVKQDLTEGET